LLFYLLCVDENLWNDEFRALTGEKYSTFGAKKIGMLASN
jgi:hypothetical protein